MQLYALFSFQRSRTQVIRCVDQLSIDLRISIFHFDLINSAVPPHQFKLGYSPRQRVFYLGSQIQLHLLNQVYEKLILKYLFRALAPQVFGLPNPFRD